MAAHLPQVLRLYRIEKNIIIVVLAEGAAAAAKKKSELKSKSFVR